ncbi:MAG: DNA-3-methyladenine glycosylase family protein [Tepidiformaceae bacterium]
MINQTDLKSAVAHLRSVDPLLGSTILKIGKITFAKPASTPYEAIGRSIIGQQLSTKAASAIHRKVASSFGNYDDLTETAMLPSPEVLRALSQEQLRSAGLSRQKIITLKELADYSMTGELKNKILENASNETIIAELTKITGIGKWTVQMFLMNYLQRPDILPTSDLGIRKAIKKNYHLTSLPTEEKVMLIGECWHPWSTVASRYLWLSLEENLANKTAK